MLGLPKSTEMSKQLSKKAVYAKFQMNTAAKEKIDADISRITIVNEITPTKINIPAGEEVGSFFISGHRRVHAAELLEMKEVPAVIHFIDRDQATILMVDSNCQRENLSLMEKARSYRMKLDAIKHQGTSRQSVGKLDESAELISENDSGRTVQRLIRLTYLMPELQEFVDNGKMKMLPAYELSFLNEEAQRDVIDRIDETESFPSHAQARRMRKAFEEGKLNYDTVTEIMAEVKPNQVEKLKIPMNDIKKYAPDCSTPKELSDHIIKLMKQDYERKHRGRDDCR